MKIPRFITVQFPFLHNVAAVSPPVIAAPGRNLCCGRLADFCMLIKNATGHENALKHLLSHPEINYTRAALT